MPPPNLSAAALSLSLRNHRTSGRIKTTGDLLPRYPSIRRPAMQSPPKPLARQLVLVPSLSADAIGSKASVYHGPNATVCFRVWLSNPLTGEDTWLVTDPAVADLANDDVTGTHMRCIPVCNKLVRFHEPAGYCPP